MNAFIRYLALALLTVSSVANAAGPAIWGPDSRALNLTTQGFTLQSGVTIDNDGINNFIKASTAETSTQPAQWSTYADAAGTSPVDCTGGSANITWTRNTTAPLRGAADFKLTKDAANRQGQGVAYAFTTGPADPAAILTVSMPVKSNEDAAYADNDVRVYVYNVTGAALITPTVTGVRIGAYTYTTQFTLNSSTSYRLCFHISSTNASAYDVYFDDITVSVQQPLADSSSTAGLVNPYAGTGVVYSGTYTPTVTNQTNISASTPYQCNYIRLGSMVIVSGLVEIDPSAGNTLTRAYLSLPIASNLTNNTTDLSGQSMTYIDGSTDGLAAIFLADAGSDRAEMVFPSTNVSNLGHYFTFMYIIK